MQFEQVIGREDTKKHLKELVSQNRLSHALLFLGREGSGALPMAIAFAQYILCERVNGKAPSKESLLLFEEPAEPLPSVMRQDSCGVCSACRKVGKLIHPDLHFSYPVIKRSAKHDRIISTDYIKEWREFVLNHPYQSVYDWIDFLKSSPTAKVETPANKQANITVQECEDILHKLSLKPYESDYKILIMWMPEFLGKEGNRLLKLIEEPPPRTVFIFVAQDENLILPTLLSRTQLVKIPPPLNQEVEKYLVEKNIPPTQALQLAALADGNIREAMHEAGHADEDWLGHIREWMNIALSGNAASQIKWVDEINGLGREKQKQLLQYFIHLLEQTIRGKYLEGKEGFMPAEKEAEFTGRLSTMCSVEVLENMAEILSQSIYHIERNAHAKMLFHSLTIKLYYLIKDKSLILVR